MTPTRSSNHGPNNAVAYLVTFPFIALQHAAALAMRSRQRRSNQAPKAPPPSQSTGSTSTAPDANPVPSVQMVADRVHSQVINGQSLNFYFYARSATIRITKRAGGVVQEALFTPAIAEANALPFTMVSAAAWIANTWFKVSTTPTEPSHSPAANAAPMQHGYSPLPADAQRPPGRQAPTQRQRPEQKDAVSDASSPAAQKKQYAPFTGQVIDFGPTQKGMNTAKPYWTYSMKLESDSEGIKEFIGEQLAELVANHDLKQGQLVTLTPLGKRKFLFDLGNGKKEDRHRNEYSIDVHRKL